MLRNAKVGGHLADGAERRRRLGWPSHTHARAALLS
jgi:hypothetical protein